jgi:multimeric flavodoxin WrbA
MATPVYFYTMCGQMKTLIDRTCARYTEISNKQFYFIIAAADNSIPAMERTLEEFRGFTSCLDEPEEKGIIYGVGAWNKGEIKPMPVMEEAYTTGKTV